ncbi:alpha/beta fold hydrolase [Oceaniradius stylonematis]|uniref:alpha/beta fold hydrolase n=1 Tax=Oceaniradius stylonematis TaxID=2184161 RepID=UPI003C7B49FA
MKITRWVFAALLAVAVIGAGTLYARYQAALVEAQQRLAAFAVEQVQTRSGPLAYAEAGDGPPVLMIHGSGGGYDQGLSMAGPLAERGYKIISPSRFGYPGSPAPEDRSANAQADVFVDLLDALGLDQVAVIGGSAGARSALAFAIRHPERCAALILIVPALDVPGLPPVEPWSPLQERLVKAALRSDFLFWLAIEFMPDRMTRLVLATDPALVAAAGPAEQARVARIRRSILPVSARAEGLWADTVGGYGDLDVRRIAVPTLAISAEDDFFDTATSARHIAAMVDGAELIVYPDGGHIWIGRGKEMFGTIAAFIDRIAGNPTNGQ